MKVGGTHHGVEQANLCKGILLRIYQMPESSPIILAFDIGIRNLAWCLLRGVRDAEEKPTILGWQNYDLLSGAGHEIPKEKLTCSRCSATATFQAGATPSCLRHCPMSHPPFKDLSGVVLKKIPGAPALKAIALARGLTIPKKATKEGLRTCLATVYSLPIEKVKLKKAVEHEIATLHDAIRTFVGANLETFRQATQICLENQPVLKNPTMKTVQILLFATLRDMLQPAPPPLKLVHAGVKVKGKEKGDAGYKSRKDASEEKVLELLQGTSLQNSAPWLQLFTSSAKKSDLADAFLMCWDRRGVATDSSV